MVIRVLQVVQIHSSGNIMYNRDNNYSRCKSKICQIIKDKDMNQLGKHPFLQPNCILSIIDD